jgi:hypothetical protein
MKTQGNIMKLSLITAFITTTLYAGTSCTTHTQFSSPQDAATALVNALKTGDNSSLTKMMGKDSQQWLFSGDAVMDEKNRLSFVEQFTQKHDLKKQNDKRYNLVIGNDEWPFAAPIVSCKKQWTFDGDAGSNEVLNRRIGANELDTIQTLLAIVDAQREYAIDDLDNNGLNDYAQKFLSSSGKKDGLYWKTDSGIQSPLGELVAAAAIEGYTKTSPAYHGYHFKILKSQSKAAQGGAYSYMSGDKMIGGFAILAYPAKYGSSGIMTFIINHDGVVYQKDLGKNSASTASSIGTFNPDKGWVKVD